MKHFKWANTILDILEIEPNYLELDDVEKQLKDFIDLFYESKIE